VGRRSRRRSIRAQNKQSRADQAAKPPLTRKHRVLLGLALTGTALVFGSLTWIAMALFLSAASREVWTHVERASWIAGVVALGLAVWGPRHRRPETSATDRHPLRWFVRAALAGVVLGGLVASIPPNPPSLGATGGTNPKLWPAVVENTYRTDPNGANPVDVGVNSYRGPYSSRQDKVAFGSHFADERVRVRCRVEDGRAIPDDVTNKPSYRWYRLEDNSYLPDPYVKAPSGVPTCDEYDRNQ
jgi:hypothetical protein